MIDLEPWGLAPLPDDMPEAAFTKKVIGVAQLHGWLAAHFRPAKSSAGRWATHMQGHPGYPDLTLARAGVVIFTELKTKSGLKPNQREWITQLGGHDGARRFEPDELAAIAQQKPHGLAGAHGAAHYVTVWRPRDWPSIFRTLYATPERTQHQ